MKRKLFLSISILLCCLFAGSTAFGYPVFQNASGDNYDVMYFQNVETWYDNDSNYMVSQGDQFVGILSVQNIVYGTENLNSEIWSASNSGTIDSFTGYFANTVVATGLDTNNFPEITLGPGDPLNILQGNEMMALYVDDGSGATGYTTNTGVVGDIANATDGNLWATFGPTLSTDYWYTDAPLTPPGVSNNIGISYGGLSIIQDFTKIPQLLAINDPLENKIDTDVDMYFRSYIGQIYNFDSDDDGTPDIIADGSAWYFVSNDPAGIKPIPEPATMLLLGSGLIGLAGFGRKKKFFKKD
ncbi:MAG: PEP-CTERM sorting domain-containing protein [Deltaproteobacteria bacterium]|nr:PEP-CTERM sorting domain-containing protein [Deltaproteobacteria bacterium]